MKFIRKILFISLFIFMFIPRSISALENEVVIHVFYGDGCGYCALEKEFLQELANEYDNLKIVLYETWYDSVNYDLFQLVSDELEAEATGVPFTIIGDYYFTGYATYMDEVIVAKIEEEGINPSDDVVSMLIEELDYDINTTYIEKVIEYDVDNVILEEEVNIHVFYGDGCGYCALEKEFLQELVNEYDNLNVILYEVWYDTSNYSLLEKVTETLGTELSGVPFTVIGDYFFSGYSSSMDSTIIQEIISQAQTPKVDVVNDLIIATQTDVTITNLEKQTNNNEMFVFIVGMVCIIFFVVFLFKTVSKEMNQTKITVNKSSNKKKNNKKNKNKKKK